jgi:periplasmic divalent cation tolerance protein
VSDPAPAGALRVALTTLPDAQAAEVFAVAALDQGAACAQVEGPIRSHYLWQGRRESSEEWRVVLKVPAERVAALRAWALGAHPYDTPQWIETEADFVAEKYLQWARGAR